MDCWGGSGPVEGSGRLEVSLRRASNMASSFYFSTLLGLHGVSHAPPQSSTCYRLVTMEHLNEPDASETESHNKSSSYRWSSWYLSQANANTQGCPPGVLDTFLFAVHPGPSQASPLWTTVQSFQLAVGREVWGFLTSYLPWDSGTQKTLPRMGPQS